MTDQQQLADEFRCPGQKSTISRAVHLGRLARFYPACRGCPRRDETGTLSARQVKRLQQTQRRAEPRVLFDDEGAAGVYLNELDPPRAEKMAAALGVYLRRKQSEAPNPPEVVITGDGRPLTPEMVAAVAEGLRWAGCPVVDVGAATAACVAFAIEHLGADGGILIGNPTGEVQTVGLKFWAGGAKPLSAEGPLDDVRRIAESGADRPTRKYGTLRRFQAEIPYLAGLAQYFHALRPLRFVLDTTSLPLVDYLEKLIEPVACRVIRCRVKFEGLADQIRTDEAHFAARIDDDAQRCRLVDDCGRAVSGELFSLLVARHLLTERPGESVVLEEETPAEIAREIGRIGGRVVLSNSRRARMDQTMRAGRAILGAGPSGRFWYRSDDGHASADALMTLTCLLRLLSRSDRPLSQVLDVEQATL